MSLSKEITSSIMPGDDFFHFVNQRWIDNNPIPADKARVGVFEELMDENIERIRVLIEAAPKKDEPINIRLLKQYYSAAMDEKQIDIDSPRIVTTVLKKIQSLSTPSEIFGYLAESHGHGSELVWNPYIEPDDKDSGRYILRFAQGGLGLPDRDYYIADENQSFTKIREHYVSFLSKLLELIGLDHSNERAIAILNLETELAKASMTATERRDPDKTYNAFEPAELVEKFSNLDWTHYFTVLGFSDPRTTIISQPAFIEAASELLVNSSIEQWQDYLLVHSLLPLLTKLSSDYEKLHFDFYGKILRGTTEQEPRYRRMIRNCMMALPEPVGQIFVMAHFDDAAKAEVTDLVERLQLAFATRINKLDWMSDETKLKAHAKLATFLPLLGYPDSWRDYSKLEVGETFATNFQAISREEWVRSVGRLDEPVDRKEWLMSPALVNAYYWPNTNGITFPAGILQPPFFDPIGDFASNYGSIGAVIGHEITHGFDDEGSKFDAEGNLKSWWTQEDRAAFDLRADGLVKQFDTYQVAGRNVNGRLTLGENIADLGGLQMAYDALQSKLESGNHDESIDGFSPQQRFFIGFARTWRDNMRPELSIQLLVSDPHSPDIFRTNGIVKNLDPFYEAFDISPEDALYLPSNERVRIW